MDKKIFTIIASAEPTLKQIEKAVVDAKIKDYVVFGHDTPNDGDRWNPERVDVLTDKDTFMKLVLKLGLIEGWW